MHFRSSSMKSAKTKEKENRSYTVNPGVFMNHATAHKYYSYESWLRIWNPGLFLIRTRSPWLHLSRGRTNAEGNSGGLASRCRRRGKGQQLWRTPSRTRGCPLHNQRGLMVVRPRTPAALLTAAPSVELAGHGRDRGRGALEAARGDGDSSTLD